MRKGLLIMGLAAILGIGGALWVCAGTKKIIKIEDGKRVEINVEQSRQEAENVTELTGAEETADGEEDYAGEEIMGIFQPVMLWGNVLGTQDGEFSVDNQAPGGYSGEVVVHFDPNYTLILDSATGFPAEAEQIGTGQTVYVYVSPMMTMSLPPQTTAELVLVNIAQDAGVPLYVTAADALQKDEDGGYLLKTVGGEEIKVPADCPITPYLTRQMVRLEDITKGRKCLVWMNADNQAERIVLFNK